MRFMEVSTASVLDSREMEQLSIRYAANHSNLIGEIKLFCVNLQGQRCINNEELDAYTSVSIGVTWKIKRLVPLTRS